MAEELEREAQEAEAMDAIAPPLQQTKPCAGVDDQTCSSGKHVPADAKNRRCPDCAMEQKRRNFFLRTKEKKERLARISAAAPPTHAPSEEADMRPPLIEDDDEIVGRLNQADDADGADIDEVLGELSQPVPPQPPPLRSKHYKPGHRVDERKAADKASCSLPWWATAKRGEMTKTAAQQQERMASTKEGKLTKRDLVENV